MNTTSDLAAFAPTVTHPDQTRIPPTAPSRPGFQAQPSRPPAPAKSSGGARRRTVIRAVAGSTLVVACVGGFIVGGGLLSHQSQVLELTHAVPAGHVLADGDLRTVGAGSSRGGNSAAGLLPASAKASLIGQTVAMPLASGALLVSGDLGAVSYPPSGKALASVAFKNGQIPDGAVPGTKVALYTSTGGHPAATGVLVGLQGPDATGGWSATVLVDADSASTVSAATAMAVIAPQ